MGKGDKRGISSAKAAESLSRAAGGGFGGFAGSTPVAPGGFAFGAKYVNAVQAARPGAGSPAAGGGGGEAGVRAAPIIPANLDSELAQQLQKLSKRDATTKLKALQALKVLVKEKPAEDVQAALPNWAYAYGRLVMDGNRSVRSEACHVTAAFAAAAGRALAPLLKSLLPPWWLAQFDGYPEAAAAARAAFAVAFPSADKRRGAVLFCRAEVLQLLGDNLASTPQGLGDPKKESTEELLDRHERVLAASCAALAALLELAAGGGGGVEAAPPGAPSAVAEQEVLQGVRAQLERPGFYKTVLQNKAAAVRRGAYALVAAAAAVAPDAVLAGGEAAAAPAVLGVLADKDPANHEAAWAALLNYARALPHAWRHVSVHKAFLPRLLAFLRHACHGSAAASYPALLPLVSLLPKEVLGPRPAFFLSLLDATWQGLAGLTAGGGAAASRQARAVGAAAYLDCLLYALLKADALANINGGGEEGGGGGGSGGGGAAADSGHVSRGQQYSAELLEGVLDSSLIPAVLGGSSSGSGSGGGGSAAGLGSEAEAVLTGAAGRLSQQPSSAAARQRLDLLLQLAGSRLAAALQAALSEGSAAAAAASDVCDRCAELVPALGRAVGPDAAAAVGAAAAQPLVAALLPEVRGGGAPPAASSLLAALLKAFPQQGLAAAEGGSAASPGKHAGGSAPADANANAAAEQFASLRLHQSASFTIDSIVRQLGDEEQPAAAAAASCDLLLCCLPQVQAPGRQLADALLQLLAAGRGDTATLLLQHLVSGQHGDLAAAAAQAGELDRVAAALAGGGDGGSALLGGGPAVPSLLALLLTGGGGSLLSEPARRGVLSQLAARLQGSLAALEAAGQEEQAEAEPGSPAEAAAAVLQVLQRCLSAPAPQGDGGWGEEVAGLLLQLLAASLRLLLSNAAAEAEAAAADSGSDAEASSFADESEAESLEPQAQPGAAATAAQGVWQAPEAVAGLLAAALPQQRAAFVAAAGQAVVGALAAHPSAAAALAVAEAAAVLWPALEGHQRQQLLQRLAGLQPADDAGGSGSGSGSGGPSAAEAVFLAAAGAAAGFDALLPPDSPDAAAQAAVAVLAGLAAEPEAPGELQAALLRHVSGACAATLLQPALHAAVSREQPAVLEALLRAAVSSGGSTELAAAARFFARATAGGGEGPAGGLPLPLLLRVLPLVAPTFRGSDMLLQQSGLAELAERLCQLSAAAEPAALATGGERHAASLPMLQAALACFPCGTGMPAAAQLQPLALAEGGKGRTGGGAFAKGDAVWYRQQDGSWTEAEVAAVDASVSPPSFGIGFGGGGSYRETEAARLRPRQPGAPPPPPLPAASAAAAEARAGGGPGQGPAGSSTEGERAALLQLLQHQGRGARAAVAAARAEAASGAAAPRGDAVPVPVAAAVASLSHAALAYAAPQLSNQHWTLVLEQLRDALARCVAALEAAAARLAAALCAAAAAVAGSAELQSPALALQFFRRLRLRGVLDRSAKAQQEAQQLAASVAAELATLDRQLAPLLLPALQVYARAAAAAPTSRTVGERDWQRAQAAALSDALQLFVTAGAVAAAASATGGAAALLAAWMGGGSEEAGGHPQAGEGAGDASAQGPPAWRLLGDVVAGTLRAADRAFLLAAVDRANAAMDATGVDAMGALLALSLSDIVPSPLAAAAYGALLRQPDLTAALTSAEGADEEQLEEAAAAGSGGGDAGDAATQLEAVGVRPELAAALAGGPAGAGFLTGWALLAAHVLAAAPDSRGRRLLVQAVKDAPALVPALLDSLVPLLPLDSFGGGSRRASAGGAAAAASPASGSSGGAGASSSSGGASFSLQLAEAGPFSAADAGDGDEASPAQRRFAAVLYAAALQALPASARLWFADLRDRATSAAVERYTSAAVSGQLLAAELAAVAEAAKSFGKYDKFTARTSAASREVVAVMEVEDGHLLELAVKLPAAMPLRAPELECRRKVGVSEGRLRKWLLSISAFLRTQNGSVAEAIILWKRNVDKEFEGQEECLICYSIIQPTNGQLPRLRCRTCAKRFHSSCLYRWFKTGKNTCPHCVSPW